MKVLFFICFFFFQKLFLKTSIYLRSYFVLFGPNKYVFAKNIVRTEEGKRWVMDPDLKRKGHWPKHLYLHVLYKNISFFSYL